MKSYTGESKSIPPCPYCGELSHTKDCENIYKNTLPKPMTTLQKLRKIIEKEFGEKCDEYRCECPVCEAHNSLEQLEILLDYYKD